MDLLKEWILNISLTLIISTALALIAPKDGAGRLFRIVLSLFILLSFIYPLAENKDITFPDIRLEDTSEERSNTYESLTENEIIITLENSGYKGCESECNLSIKGDEIYIDKVTVIIPQRYDKEEVKDSIFNSLGIISEVQYFDE